MPGHGHQKNLISLWKLRCSCPCKKSNLYSWPLSWNVDKILQICYFWYFELPGQGHQKNNYQPVEKLWCSSTFKKSIWFLISWYITFLRIIQSDGSRALFRPTTWKNFCNIRGFQWNLNNKMIFHFRFFWGKNDDKTFQKIQKTPFSAHSGQSRFFLNILFLPVFFIVPRKYHWAKFQKNTNEQI